MLSCLLQAEDGQSNARPIITMGAERPTEMTLPAVEDSAGHSLQDETIVCDDEQTSLPSLGSSTEQQQQPVQLAIQVRSISPHECLSTPAIDRKCDLEAEKYVRIMFILCVYLHDSLHCLLHELHHLSSCTLFIHMLFVNFALKFSRPFVAFAGYSRRAHCCQRQRCTCQEHQQHWRGHHVCPAGGSGCSCQHHLACCQPRR